MEQQLPATTSRTYSLIELGQGFAEVTKQIEDSGGLVDEDLLELHSIAKNIFEGKFDHVGRFIDALESHNEACRAQICTNNVLLSKVRAMVDEAVRAQPTQRIDGKAYVGKVSKNPPSVEILNEDLVPPDYKNVKVEIKDKFPMTDRAKYISYRNFIVGRSVGYDGLSEDEAKMVDECIEITVDKKRIASHAKTVTIPGINIIQTTRVDLKAGKAKPQMLNEGSNGK